MKGKMKTRIETRPRDLQLSGALRPRLPKT